jgi:hypothetical protein
MKPNLDLLPVLTWAAIAAAFIIGCLLFKPAPPMLATGLLLFLGISLIAGICWKGS